MKKILVNALGVSLMICGLAFTINSVKANVPGGGEGGGQFVVYDTVCCKNNKVTGFSNDCKPGGNNCVDNNCDGGASEKGAGECGSE